MDLTSTLLTEEKAAWDANLAGDGDYYDKWLLDDAIAVSPWGVLDRHSAVATIRENRNPYTNYRLDDAKSVAMGPDAAILTYRAEVTGENDGEPFTHTVYASSGYVRRDGVWRGAFHQQTLLA
jgi:hypothetical protein